MIDIHTHLLPSIDDGPETIEESVELCKIAANDGIKKIVATPTQRMEYTRQKVIRYWKLLMCLT